MNEERDPTQPRPGVTYSQWFPHTGTEEEASARVAELLRSLHFEPRPDPALDASWDGFMLLDRAGKLMRWPMKIVRSPRPAPQDQDPESGKNEARSA